MSAHDPSACSTCPIGQSIYERTALMAGTCDSLVALMGNPNTGKSTVFNRLTGLRQHTGNWPGKTTDMAEGVFSEGGRVFKVVDLPGTYSLEAADNDEKVSSRFLREAEPDVTVVVADATALERNLLLCLQVMALRSRVVVAVNLIDEAQGRGISVDFAKLSEELGVPVVPMAARRGQGVSELRRILLDLSKAVPLRNVARNAKLPDSEDLFRRSGEIVKNCVSYVPPPKLSVDWRAGLDWLLTSRWTAFPIMFAVFATVLWLTIVGANYPSHLLYVALVEQLHPFLKHLADAANLPWWLSGVLVDGMYLAGAWVVCVMLPPMAIFFPMFTFLEDLGYLPRVAFNMDGLFSKAGAHGKQALTMAMGYGCNAAGVVAARIIESPREKLVAILTNNFALCNGRWPTLILLSSLFVAPLAPRGFGTLFSMAAILTVALLGVAFSLGAAWVLSRTLLKGEPCAFHLEIPPIRRPSFWQVLYTSLIDRTIFVLWRAVVFAFPAGAVIWLVANVPVAAHPLAHWLAEGLSPLAWLMGLNGVILLAYVVAIPANELVVPTILMLTVTLGGQAVSGGTLFDPDKAGDLRGLLTGAGWTTLTALSMMLFCLCHNPCSTTILTIYKETKSVKWAFWATAMPLAMGLVLCALFALVWRLLA
ncbi:MAG TPA: ferrous iron transporter B [Opitutales bacterium]|nr:ferrous iron transporter B [Opitutales bacterium]